MSSVEILLLFILIITVWISLHEEEDNVDYMRSVIDDNEEKERISEERKNYLHCPLCGYSGDWDNMQTHISNRHKCDN